MNQLLQSTGAIAVKKATCILYKDLHLSGLKWGCHFAFVAHIHDEIQAIVKPQHVSVYKDLAIKSFEKAGEFFDLKCPLTGEAKEGKNCHWIIDPPNGPVSTGTCKSCGETKDFKNSVEFSSWYGSKSDFDSKKKKAEKK